MRDAVATRLDPADRLDVVVADLTDDEGWADAVRDGSYVQHVASPLGGGNERESDELPVPGREGTLRALRAAVEAGVRPMVLTSSGAVATPVATGDVTVADPWAALVGFGEAVAAAGRGPGAAPCLDRGGPDRAEGAGVAPDDHRG